MLDALTKADLVVDATITNVKIAMMKDSVFYTVAQLKVNKVIKGFNTEDYVELVYCHLGRYSNFNSYNKENPEHYALPNHGCDYILRKDVRGLFTLVKEKKLTGETIFKKKRDPNIYQLFHIMEISESNNNKLPVVIDLRSFSLNLISYTDFLNFTLNAFKTTVENGVNSNPKKSKTITLK